MTAGGAGRRLSLPFSMSVPQAMEWLIEHAEDPTIDTPLPGQASPGAAGAEAAPEAVAGPSDGDEEAGDELTEIFKKIRRKREFRADARVRVSGLEQPGSAATSPPEARAAGPAVASPGDGAGMRLRPGADAGPTLRVRLFT